MFANDSFPQTYSGPIYASGEAVQRARNAAMAQSAFSGNQRANRRVTGGAGGLGGVRAGSKLDAYRAGVAADVDASKAYAAAQQTYGENILSNAEARQQYEGNRAEEQSSIRDLLRNRDQVNQGVQLDMRGLQKSVQAQTRQREVENRVADLKRKSSFGGILAGLFG